MTPPEPPAAKPAVEPSTPVVKTTTFALPPPQLHSSSSTSLSGTPPLKPTASILNRLGRRLSQSKTLVRRVSLGSRNAAPQTPTSLKSTEPPAAAGSDARATSSAGDERDSPPASPTPHPLAAKGPGLGLRRSLRALGRSRSEGTATGATGKRPREAPAPRGEQWRTAAGWRVSTDNADDAEIEGETPPPQLLWEERLGLCWDGREQVLPDSAMYEPYNSNSDVLPTRVVYASTLSTYAPRPPLVARASLPPTPAALVISEYRARHPLSPSHSSPSLSELSIATADTSASATPIPTPRPQPPGTGHPKGHHHPSSVRSLASDVSSSEIPMFAHAGGSQDSNTSLESMQDDLAKAPPAFERFALVDSGPVVPPPPPELAVKSEPQRRSRVEWLTFQDAREELSSEGGSSEGDSDWRECE